MGYTVVKELAIPRELMELPINPTVFKAFGFAATTLTPQEIMLAQVELLGASYGGMWNVKAMVNAGTNEQPEIVEIGEINCDTGTSIDDVLEVADTWIRESDKSEFVPGQPIRLQIPDESMARFLVSGITLVRASA